MNLKYKWSKLLNKIKSITTSETQKEFEKISKSEDALGYGALNDALDRLFEYRNNQNKELPIKRENLETKDLIFKKEEKEPIILSQKIDEFINWYSENIVKCHQSPYNEYQMPINMRNFIEKMAVWYELRYPDYEVERFFLCTNMRNKDTNNFMFKTNPYINELFDDDTEAKILDWDEFYNKQVFINSLPIDELDYFRRAEYSSLRYDDEISIELTKDGIIKSMTGFNYLLWSSSKENINKKFIGQKITKVLPIMKEICARSDIIEKLENTVMKVENKNIQVDEMLNCVMYRILERGKNRIAPRRAFLFVKEFERNIDIPMMYGADYKDPGLRSFIIEYLKAGGSLDLVCFKNYYYRTSENDKILTGTIKELLSLNNNYTYEEHALHQRLVNSIKHQEEVKKLELK